MKMHTVRESGTGWAVVSPHGEVLRGGLSFQDAVESAERLNRETKVETTQAPARTLVKKLAAIMAEVERVPKAGRNESHRYDYATEADIAAAVRKGMAERGVILFPSVEKMEWADLPTKSGGTQKLCTLTVKFTLEDGDSGETRSYTIIGQGSDTGDKASYKAMTGAEKYALLKLFLIPTGDDPETEEPVRRARTAAQQAPTTHPRQPEPQAAPAKEAQPKRLPKNGSDANPTMRYGKGKGKRATELTDDEFQWQMDAARAAVGRNDAQWGEWHREHLRIMELHEQRRALARQEEAPDAR